MGVMGSRVGLWSFVLAWGTIAVGTHPAIAQVVPDGTLGSERSVVTPNVTVRGRTADRIDGGAVRGSSLFHSFERFNVRDGQSVYFGNPTGINHIFGRVTGGSVSNILGTLGVDGVANLYLLNPNGIFFGPNARLDIRGSFVGSTGDRLVFPDGSEFSATDPQAPPLLTVSAPAGVQFGAGAIGRLTNRGNLSAGQNLTLSAHTLDLEGQLRAGGDLSLQALDTLRIRDSVTDPFIAAAGGRLVVQGNRAVDIFALNNRNSGLFAGGDLVLRSNNTVGGDAHYWSGGNFRIEQLNGELGNLFSPNDPVIRSAGDVSFLGYVGSSLHIFAGGSVTIPGFIAITGADPVNGIVEAVTLADGITTVPIDGRSEPTLDIRAGTTAFLPPGAVLDGGTVTPGLPDLTAPPASNRADITVGLIYFATPGSGSINAETGEGLTPIAGQVLLTNQYRPNALQGDIRLNASLPGRFTNRAVINGALSGGGDTAIDSRGEITVAGNIEAFPEAFVDFNTGPVFTGNGGNVYLGSQGNITLTPGSAIDSTGVLGGSTTIRSGGNVSMASVLNPDGTTRTPGGVFSFNVGSSGSVGGSIDIRARSLSLSDGAILTTSTIPIGLFREVTATPTNSTASANSGNITINTSESVQLTNNSQIRAIIESGGSGTAGDINIATGTLSVLNSQIGNVLFREISNPERFPGSRGAAGSITVNARREVILSGTAQNGFSSGLFSSTERGASGNAGNINVDVRSGLFRVENGAVVSAVTANEGRGGDIAIRARDFEVLSGGRIFAVSRAAGEPGNIAVLADDIRVDGFDRNYPSRIENIRAYINDPSLSSGEQAVDVLNFEYLSEDGIYTSGLFADSAGSEQVRAGDIFIRGNNTINITNRGTILARGRAADEDSGFNRVVLSAPQGSININQGLLNTSNNGNGFAGDILLGARNRITISQSPDSTQRNLGLISEGNFGRILIGNVPVSPRNLTLPSALDNLLLPLASPQTFTINNSTLSTTNRIGRNGGAFGRAGDITLSARNSITITNPRAPEDRPPEVGIFSETLNDRTAGNVSLSAPNGSITVIGGTISARTALDVDGSAGKVQISADSITVRNSAEISTATFGRGDAGDVVLRADDRISLSNGALVFSTVESGARGNAGRIEVDTPLLSMTGRSELQTLVRGADARNGRSAGIGNAGNILLSVRDRIFLNSSRIFNELEESTIGSGGNIYIGSRIVFSQNSSIPQIRGSTRSIVLTNEARLDSDTAGDGGSFEGISYTGNAGDIFIRANQLTLERDSRITNAVLSGAGSLTSPVRAGRVDIGAGAVFLNDGRITSNVERGAVGNGGSISIQARTLNMINDSDLQTQANSRERGNAGNVSLAVTDGVFLDNSEIFSNIEEDAVGNGGSIFIVTRSFSMAGSSELQTQVNRRGQGNAGNVVLGVSDTVSINNSKIFSNIAAGAVGNGGNILIVAPDFSMTGGSQMQTQINERSRGVAGNIFLSVRDRIFLDNSDIFSSLSPNAVGRGGAIFVGDIAFRRDGSFSAIRPTGTLSLTNGAQLVTSTAGRGEPRRTPNIQQAELNGNAGNVFVVARRFSINGVNPAGFRSAVFSGVEPGGQGAGGNVLLIGGIAFNTKQELIPSSFQPAERLTLSNGAVISVSSFGLGRIRDSGNDTVQTLQNAGSIVVATRAIQLTGGGRLFGETSTGTGGNISLEGLDRYLLLRDQSWISTTAGIEGGIPTGNAGGNISILDRNADSVLTDSANRTGRSLFIVAEPFRNNDISANAYGGPGGQVTLRFKGALGLTERSSAEVRALLGEEFRQDPGNPTRLLRTSDVSAFSTTDSTLDGEVIFDGTQFNTQEVGTLPTDLPTPPPLNQACPTDSTGADRLGRFTTTGRGGLPANLNEAPLESNAVITRLATVEGNPSGQPSATAPEPAAADAPLVEAQGLVTAVNGDAFLVADASTATPQAPSFTGINCNAR
jgi:filamentous hemagglutinin family protein